MRVKSVSLIIGALAFGLSTPAQSQEQDDFYVDLSASADNMQYSDSVVVKQEPLFPIMTKEDLAKVQAREQAKKKRYEQKKAAAEKPIAIITPKEIIINDETSVAEESIVEDTTPVVVGVKPDIAYEDVKTEEIKETVSPAPVSPVAEEAEPVEETITAAPEEIIPAPAKESAEEKVLEKVEEIKKVEEVKEEIKKEDVKGIVELFAPEDEAPKVVEPLVPVDNAEKKSSVKVPNQIFFAANSTSLAENDKSIIDAVISSFEDVKANKIGILSYNYDDGNDSFRKKRQSLNRAVEVRSYLLGKGYKNFSIKVVNTTDDSSKENLVEIEEIK